MSLTISLEFSDQDLQYFRDMLAAAQERAAAADTDTILAHSRAAFEREDLEQAPDFVRERVEQLRTLVEMLGDEDWPLEEQERQDVVSALAYFYRPDDLIADDVPVLGLLDDAIMTELLVGEMRHQITAYREYCEFRASAELHGGKHVSREDWYKARKHEIFERMRRRLERQRRASGGSGRLTSLSLS